MDNLIDRWQLSAFACFVLGLVVAGNESTLEKKTSGEGNGELTLVFSFPTEPEITGLSEKKEKRRRKKSNNNV